MCLFSFLMPAYKSAYIKQALDSIVGQTFSDWELFVVDDCSPEDLGEIVRPYCAKDSRIRYVRNSHNIGGNSLVEQWNHCLRFASGEWVVMASDDDMYASNFCEEVYKLSAKYPTVDLIRARVLQVDAEGKELWQDGKPSEFVDKVQYLDDWIAARMFTCIGNFAFRRAGLLNIGGFHDYPHAFGSDITTPMALSVNGVAHTADMLFSFRFSSDHLTGDMSVKKDKIVAITELNKWLFSLDYISGREKDIHAKCIYDYFNHCIKWASISELPDYLRLCQLASRKERIIMLLRWIKNLWKR